MAAMTGNGGTATFNSVSQCITEFSYEDSITEGDGGTTCDGIWEVPVALKRVVTGKFSINHLGTQGFIPANTSGSIVLTLEGGGAASGTVLVTKSAVTSKRGELVTISYDFKSSGVFTLPSTV